MAQGLAKALAAAGALPGIEESTSYGTPSLKVRGKFIARIKEPGILVVRCPLEEKEMLMAAAPGIYFETDHYKGWPAVLIRMSKIAKTDLAKRLETAWRMQAPKSLQKAFDSATAAKTAPNARTKLGKIGLGIVTGVAFEAALLRPYSSDDLILICAGLRPNAAQTAAEVLIDRGATALMSFGIAGGLDPQAAAGRIIVASEVRGENVFGCDPGWTKRLAALAGIAPVPVAHAAQVIAVPAAKAALYTATGAAAADMESYGVGEVAADHGLPFAVLRVVADTAGDTIPSVALNAVSPDGDVRHAQAILGALTHPWQIPELMRLGRRTAIAAAVLKDLARLGAGLFGLM